jgi:hypothetical protein
VVIGNLSAAAAELLEDLVLQWIRHSELGQQILADLGIPEEDAVQRILELMEAGMLRIEGNFRDLPRCRYRIVARGAPGGDASWLRWEQ